LNRFPELKQFLKEGEAESYQGVTVTYVAGKTAVMTIYKDGIEQEQVIMHELATRQDMHQMMKQKGFVLKESAANQETADEMRELLGQQEDSAMAKRQAQLLQRRAETKQRVQFSNAPQYSKSLQYVVVFGVVGMMVVEVLRRRRRIGRVI
jgi:hypothetical protein